MPSRRGRRARMSAPTNRIREKVKWPPMKNARRERSRRALLHFYAPVVGVLRYWLDI